MDKTLKMSLLFDFYGPLLTERQQSIYEMYFHEDLSLGEISEEFDVSRQAVYDMLKRSTQTLEQMEGKLGLVKRYQRTQYAMESINGQLQSLSSTLERLGRDDLAADLRGIQDKVKALLADD